MTLTMNTALHEVSKTGLPVKLVLGYGISRKGLISTPSADDTVVAVSTHYHKVDGEYEPDSTEPQVFVAIDSIVTLSYLENGE